MSAHVTFTAWRGEELAAGLHLGTAVTGNELILAEPVGTRRYADPHADPRTGPPTDRDARSYEWAAWLSPVVEPGHPFTELVPSWNATTPEDGWIEVEARVSSDGVHWGRWFCLGRWADSDREIHPTSQPDQADDHAEVRTDVLAARGDVSWTAFQLRVTLLRGPAGSATPAVSLLGAMVSAAGEPAGGSGPVSGPVSGGRGVELPVPAYSQMTHRDEYPRWDSGGQSWCSPTSVSMVLAGHGRGPSALDLDWVRDDVADPAVPHAARHVFDYAYGGAGNWSFNAAYAAGHGTEAFVTRLRSLDEAERFVAAGLPLVASVSFRREQLDGARYDTAGHLLVIVGFDEAGDVIVNDPASHELPSNDEVRVVYDREQFSAVWLGSADGLVYVIRPHDVPLPERPLPDEPNW